MREKNLDLGNWLRSHREKLDMNQKIAAKRAKISRTQWARYETGESGASRRIIPRLAKAVEADLHETYRKAGFTPPNELLYIPSLIEDFNLLPLNVKEDLAIQIKALRQKYESA
ncbi:MAG TPA: helix-turn-helix transcriptional regulator [Pyrinomonadaceae bacterium]|nr:helix-turn-helix transcriptional regulator [Pyrinomonadaceae bacterium]